MKKFTWNNEEYFYEVVEDYDEYNSSIETIIYKGTKIVPLWDLIFWKSKRTEEVPIKIATLQGYDIENPYRNKEETKKLLDIHLGAANRKLEIERGELI